jgi:sn-glycerol 3-phosphate transport system ATP-binding protein
MVYVTHDQTEAMSMADQVILMHAGRIEQDAAPAEMYRKPATVFAARFIGTPPMNVVPLTPVAGGLAIRDDATVVAGAPHAGALLGIRPEDIRIAPTGAPARVEQVEYLGADSILSCRVGAEPVLVRAPGQVAHAAGDTIALAWDPPAQHFFEAASGRRID